MKKYLAPEVELFALAADVIMASVEDDGTSIGNSDNETAKDYIADLVIGGVDNI